MFFTQMQYFPKITSSSRTTNLLCYDGQAEHFLVCFTSYRTKAEMKPMGSLTKMALGSIVLKEFAPMKPQSPRYVP